MDARTYLNQYREIALELSSLDDEIMHLEAELDAIRVVMDGMPRGTDLSDVTGNRAVKLADFRTMVEIRKADADDLRRDIFRVIEGTSGAMYRRLLYDRYILGYQWTQIADDLGYSVSHTKKLHRAALREAEKMIHNDTP